MESFLDSEAFGQDRQDLLAEESSVQIKPLPRFITRPLLGLGPRACGLDRECFTQHLRCERPFHESWHKCVHEAIQSARNYSGPVFPQRVKALGYALLHAHQIHRHGPRVEPELGQHRRVCRRGRASQRPPRPGGFGLQLTSYCNFR